MTRYRRLLPGLGAILALYLLIRGSYYLLSPMPFLIALAVFLSVLYFLFFLANGRRMDAYKGPEQMEGAARPVSAVFLLLLFAVSLKVVNDYQEPGGERPYFSNADHHALRSECIAFRRGLTLFSEREDTLSGIWPVDKGSLQVIAEGDRLRLQLRDFYNPVFATVTAKGRAAFRLLNPQFAEPLSDGFEVKDGANSLRFVRVARSPAGLRARIRSLLAGAEPARYDLDFVFLSSDPEIVADTSGSVADTFKVRGLTLRKGLGIMDILLRDSDSVVVRNSLRLQRWLSRYTGLQILSSEEPSGERTLNLFLPEDAVAGGLRVSRQGRSLALSPGRRCEMAMAERFFVGLGNERDSFSVAPVDAGIFFQGTGHTHVLRPGRFGYRKLAPFAEDGRRNGTDEIRFLSNAPGEVNSFHLREGILFHEATKDNGYTGLQGGILRYGNHAPGEPLQWGVWPRSPRNRVDAGAGRFMLPSRNDALGWVYGVKDFSDNAFRHARMRVYMGILMGLILVVVILFPARHSREGRHTRSLLVLETPVWMVAYVMLTYRLLLLWRVATFPPVEGIGAHEFGTLQTFDMYFQGVYLYLPLTVWIFVLFVLAIVLHRTGLSGRWGDGIAAWVRGKGLFSRFTSMPLWQRSDLRHAAVLVAAFILKAAVPVDFLIRMLELLVPVASYFYFTHRAMALKSPDPQAGRSHGPHPKPYAFIRLWIDSEQAFLISTATFVSLALQDRGFAVMFIVFLILKNVFLGFSRKPLPGQYRQGLMERLLKPSNQHVYGIIALVLFVLFLTWKGLPDLLLEHRRSVALLMLPVAAVCLRVLLPGFRRSVAVATALITGVAVCILLPWTWSWMDARLQREIRHVKYRASLIHRPLGEVLRNEAYRSGAEQKIIETAQNQWFIHTYLDHAEQFPRRIKFQPHFRTGVDYSTQTRDVVLPRYVIAEFGYLTMFGVILLVTLPLLGYLLFFRLNDSAGHPDADSVTGLLALTFLFVSALVVWMSSTNRFVFFGQDFPFLSLTSRLSVMLPLTLLYVLLTRSPLCRENSSEMLRRRMQVVGFFTLLISTMAMTGGKSQLLREGHFQPDLKNIRDRIEGQVSQYFEEAQRGSSVSANSLADVREDARIGRWLDEMVRHPDFKPIYDSLSVYEKSMIDALVATPAMGFDLRSPIHIVLSAGTYSLRFNNWFRFERPFYDADKVWKGDIYEPIAEDGTLVRRPPAPIAPYVQMLPPAFFKPGTRPFAMVDLHNFGAVVSPELLLYKPRERELKALSQEDFAIRVEEQDLLLFRDGQANTARPSGGYTAWNLNDGTRRHFAFNAMVNGRQRMLFPLRGDYSWMREWAIASRTAMEGRGGSWLDSSVTVNLDYDLTRSASRHLRQTLSRPATNSTQVLVSAVAADGEGRLRLLVDHAMRSQRRPIDPNSEGELEEMLREQYFLRNNSDERLQWGNANLLHMRDGPGSSIKPLVTAAVASQRRMEWDRLEYVPHTGSLLHSDLLRDRFRIGNYAGEDWPTSPGWWEDARSNLGSDLERYISQSHNLHHSLIVFLGSYSKYDFPRGSLTEKLKPSRTTDAFPLAGLAGTSYALPSKADWPKDPVSGKPFGNTNSLMAVGLSELFGLDIQSSYSSGRLSEKRNYSRLPDSLAYRSVWAFPERSYFDQAERAGNLQAAILQTTLGGGVFRITPVQTLEMYARLFNQDQAFRVSIDSASGPVKDWRSLDPEWGGRFLADFLETGRDGRNALFPAMRSVVMYGTAKYLRDVRLPAGYTLYAKTGTIGSGRSDNSKRLIVAIVKDGPEPFPRRRKYFVYFTVQNAYIETKGMDVSVKQWFVQPVYVDLLNRILDSRSFKEYMR